LGQFKFGSYLDPMWQAWDLAVDICLSQLPALIEDPNLEYKVHLSKKFH
jgi:hypothetical protein